MRSVDDLVGDVIKALVGTGKLENTIILFTSDNGYLHGEHRQNEKFVAFEESIRVPLYVRLPGRSMQVRNQVVLNNDLAPTIAELAGVTPQLKVDGTSFVPLLGTPLDSWRRRFLVEHWQAGDVDASDVPTDVPTYAAVRTWSWYTNNMLYVQYEDPAQTPEMYDMMRDPDQPQQPAHGHRPVASDAAQVAPVVVGSTAGLSGGDLSLAGVRRSLSHAPVGGNIGSGSDDNPR